jgi:cell wall-associated NlpC family hydrolase
VRRIAALVLLVLVLGAAGCAEERSDSNGQRTLNAWTFPRKPFIPHVKAVAKTPAPKPQPKPAAPKPAAAPASSGPAISSGAPSDAEIRAQLRELYGEAAGADPAKARTVALSGGLATAPPDAPERLQRLVAAANQVARLPYVYGGGHGGGGGEGIWTDNAYDCSGSVSFALASAGYLKSPMDSGSLARWGKPGRGKWVTIYANAGHAFMVVGGARFDTVGLKQSGSRWQPAYRSISGFTARHPPGL